MTTNSGSAGSSSNIGANFEDIYNKVNQEPESNRLRELIRIFSDRFNQQNINLDELQTRLDKQQEKVDANLKEVDSKLIASERKSIEAIAIIASIIGLGVSFVSVGAGQKDVFTSVITLILTVCSFGVFATLIHLYFNDNKFIEKSKDIISWTVITAITMLILSIIGQKGLSMLIFKIFNPREPNQIVLFDKLFVIKKDYQIPPSPNTQ